MLIPLALACLVCASHGRRVHIKPDNSEQEHQNLAILHPGRVSRMPRASSTQVRAAEALASLLRGVDPEVGWQIIGGAHPRGPELRCRTSQQTRSAQILCAEDSSTGGFSTAKPKKKIFKKKRKGEQTSKNRGKAYVNRMEAAASTRDAGRERLQAMRKQSGFDISQWTNLQKETKTERQKALEEEGAGVMPEVVSERMLGRIVRFAAIPVTLAFAVLIGFWQGTARGVLDIPANYVAYITIFLLVSSFGGITFGVLSTQLDQDGEQSTWGTENIKKNWDSIRGVEEEQKTDELQRQEDQELKDAGFEIGRESEEYKKQLEKAADTAAALANKD